MEEIKLSKNQEVERINVKPADNGGCVLTYTLYTPSGTHSESKWDEQTEIYKEGEFEEKAIPRIVELYKADYYSRMEPKEESKGEAMPMKASGY